MALGFDFNQLMTNPMFQMGIGMLAQPRSWQNQGFGGMAQGAMQGMGNLQQAQQFQQYQKLQQLQMEDLQQKREAAQRKMKILQDTAEIYKGRVQKPRPLAFMSQAGDEQTRKNYEDNQVIGNMLAAGIDPTDIAHFNAVLNPKSEGFTLAPGAQHYQGGKLVAENPLKDKPDVGISRELQDIMDKRDATAPGSATWKYWNQVLQTKATHAPPVQVNMPSFAGVEVIKGPDGRPHRVAVQIGKDGKERRTDLGIAASTNPMDAIIGEALAGAANKPTQPVSTRSAIGKIGGGPSQPGFTQTQADWFKRAKAANPSMTDEQIMAEGRRLGKM